MNDLSFKVTTFWGSTEMSISGNTLSLGDKVIKDIKYLKAGIIVNYVNGIKTSTYSVIEIGNDNSCIKLKYIALFYFKGRIREYHDILDKLQLSIIPLIVSNLKNNILMGEQVKIGKVAIQKNHVCLRKKGLFGRKFQEIPLKELQISIRNGQYILIDRNNTCKESIQIINEKNAIILPNLLQSLIMT